MKRVTKYYINGSQSGILFPIPGTELYYLCPDPFGVSTYTASDKCPAMNSGLATCQTSLLHVNMETEPSET